MRLFVYVLGLPALVLSVLALAHPAVAQQPAPVQRPNVLLITADDMNWNTPGCFGGTVPNATPNIDRLAHEGMRFWHAHVNVAVCTPSRSVMLTGLYPQHSNVEGFQPIRPGTPTLPSILNEFGYLCGTIGKPLGQQETFRWSVTYRWQGAGNEEMWGRDPAVFRRFAKSFFEMARASGQPFFLMANSHDPHRPFTSSELERQCFGKPHYERAEPSRVYRPDEVTVPAFLPDLPEIRREIAEYSSSVRRCDDTVGAILDELRLAGFRENTIIIFLSDNGMAFPFAKTNCYLHSTRTPLIVRWPGRIKPDAIDRQHMVSAVDLLPTILEAVNVPADHWSSHRSVATTQFEPGTPRFDGRSLLPLLDGKRQSGRVHVFTQFNHIHGLHPYPMRCVLTKRLAYIFNPWSNNNRLYRAEPLTGLTFRAMQQAAAKDEAVTARVRHLEYRTTEELYDMITDPDCLHNVIDNDDYHEQLADLCKLLCEWMEKMNDCALTTFKQRNTPEALDRFMKRYSDRAKHEIEERKVYEQATGYWF